MKTRVISTVPQSSLTEVVGLMRAKKIDAVPVMDQGKLIGIVATLDIAPVTEEKWGKTLVQEIMKKRLVVGYASESLYDALAKMTKNNISHLPIVDANNPKNLLGILTINDIAHAYSIDGKDVAD